MDMNKGRRRWEKHHTEKNERERREKKIADEANWKIKLRSRLCDDDKSSFFGFSTN